MDPNTANQVPSQPAQTPPVQPVTPVAPPPPPSMAPMPPTPPAPQPAPHNFNWKLVLSLVIGFGAILVLFFGGAYYMGVKQYQSVGPVPTVAPRPTPTPIASPSANIDMTNWLTYTKNGYSFKYPSTWTTQQTQSTADISEITIVGSNKVTVDVLFEPAGVGGKCDDNPDIDMGHDQITMFDMPLNLFYQGSKKSNTIQYAYVLKESETCPNIAFVNLPDNKLGYSLMNARIYYGSSDNYQSLSPTLFKSSDFETAKAILSTFKLDQASVSASPTPVR